MEEINTQLVKGKTISYLLGALNNSKAHAGELLAKTEDFDGYKDLIAFLDELRESIVEFEDKI